MTSEPLSPGKWGDLTQRLVSGGCAAAIGLGLMWWGGVPFKLLISIIVGIMIWEVGRMVGAGTLAAPLGVLACVIMIALALLPTGLVLPLVLVPLLPPSLLLALCLCFRLCFRSCARSRFCFRLCFRLCFRTCLLACGLRLPRCPRRSETVANRTRFVRV